MSLEQRAKILQTAASKPYGVRELAQTLKIKNSTLVSLLRVMQQEKLIEVNYAKTTKKGRPKKCVTASQLGYDFLDTYRKLNLKRLTARKADLDHASKDATYASKLAENGHSTFQLFMELNTIARNIKKSS